MLVVALTVGLLAAPVPPSSREPSSPGPADATTPASRRDRVVVGVSALDPALDPAALDRVLAGHLAGTGLQHRVARLSGRGEPRPRLHWADTFAVEPDVLAVFWIEGAGDERRLYLFDPRERSTWVRPLPATSDADELLETLGTMVRSISTWLGHGSPPDMDVVEAPSEPPGPAPPEGAATGLAADPEPADDPPRTRVGMELAYLGGSVSSQFPWQHGGAAALWIVGPKRAAGELSVGVLGPAIVAALPRTIVWRAPVRLAAGVQLRPGRPVRPSVDAGVVAEAMVWEARSTTGVEARSGRALRVAVSPGAGLRWELGPGVTLGLHAQADVWVLNADLVVSMEGRRVPRLAPHAVSAQLRAGLGYAF